ncbi:multiheme c-type cytochrome [Paraflavitalea sp. CAU 1676]|uniref:multiheme c-type cytochrome n=1 Tax=Paraflavitalea sp. CAU 1676 TaxID=3032598 RepID=UPI0023DBA6D0|nr:multiheme c-type cytochrome [Paraflavitalea sp. CAU 1676]MDF2188113.1 multiheme c-type cytochrome [Paraflavitalea sp. CAU 1676]
MKRTQLLIATCFVLLILGLSQCMDAPPESALSDLRGAAYAGADACNKCHQDIHQSWLATAHRNTSASPSPATIKGSFEPGKNAFHYRQNVKVQMEQRATGLYQVAYMNDVEKQAFPFGVVVGSGRKAQTYLYWLDDNAFQLPVSYSVNAAAWVNSPSYPADKVRFDRLINIGCFECHGSYIERKGTQQEGNRQVDYFDKSKVIYGMDCERCHGPAAAHVNFHTAHPEEKQPQHIALYKKLPRQQQLDLCAQCHSGGHTSHNSIFYFKPGDSLSQYFSSAVQTGAKAGNLDVHGNQYQLMTASACYIKSDVLTCTSCHDPHVQERENLAALSQRCTTCHTSVTHSFTQQLPANAINSNCIDCHMPALPSSAISLKEEDKTEANANLVRTHKTGIYADQTKAFIEAYRKR